MAPAILLTWPLVGLTFFAALGPVRGLIWSTAFGYLFLPEAYNIDLPLLPEYDKFTAVALSGVLGVVLYRQQLAFDDRHLAAPKLRRIMLLCLAVLVLAPALTVLTNGETLVNGPAVRPALRPWDAISMSADLFLRIIPFFLAWRYLGRVEDMRELLLAIAVLGLGYTLLVLFEIRMSPQLHNWIYGYFQHSWLQHIRDGDFRPLVFLRHGLWLGFFLLSVVIAAFALARQEREQRRFWLFGGLWALFVLTLSSNLGATMLAAIFCPAVFFMTRRMQILLASAVAIVLLAYPALKHYSATPADRVLTLAERVSTERAQSFQVRLKNETELLDRGLEKPFFGWGGWGRGRIYDEFGRDLSITDGIWIIIFNQRGWTGYLAFFGLLTLPILWLGRTARRKEVPPIITGMALMSAANFIYMIPNSTLSPIGLLVFGALAAFTQYDSVRETDAVEGDALDVSRAPALRYSRFHERSDKKAPEPLSLTRGSAPTYRYRRDTPPTDV